MDQTIRSQTLNTLKVKRIYESATDRDGIRVLVDRLWPRGMSKEAAHVDHWLKDISPSSELRTWFGHDPLRWDEFRERYSAELAEQAEQIGFIRELLSEQNVTLLYSARSNKFNNAIALSDYINNM